MENERQGFSRRFSSFSTASRMNSARLPGPASASTRAITVSDRRTCVALTPSGGRPMREALSGIFLSAKPAMFPIPPIDHVFDTAYIDGIGYEGKKMVPEIKYIHDGEWAQISCGNGQSIAVYPRDDGTFSIGRPDVPGCWRDLDRQTGFANMQAAIDQAVWLAEEPDMLRQVWS